MGRKDYKRAIIESLLGKYHRRMAKGTDTARRIALAPTELYRNYADNNADIAEKQAVNEAAAELLRMGFITRECLKFSTDIKKIYLCEDKTEEIYGYLENEYGVMPQSAVLKGVRELREKYKEAGMLVQNYCADILRQAEHPGAQMDLGRIEANLKMLDFLEKNRESLCVREASMLVYGDSKWFENNNFEEVCNIVRNVLKMPAEEGEPNDAALARYLVAPMEQEIFIKGDWKLEWEGAALEIGGLSGGIAIASGDIAGLRKITVSASRLMTIENKTSYQRMKEEGTAFLYLGGYANRYQIQFLRKVIRDNPDISCCHFGDIDAGGFFIHRHLCRATSVNFAMFCMGIEQLRDGRFRDCLRELTQTDADRLQTLEKEDAYREVVEYMKAENVKLEQEIVSYYLAGCGAGGGQESNHSRSFD